MGSDFLSSLKRPITTTTTDPTRSSSSTTSSNKRHKPQHQTPPPVPAGHVSFRLLCSSTHTGGVIGRSGSIVKQLQQLTGARIRVEDALPDCPDRVITITGPSAVVSKLTVVNNSSGDGGKEEAFTVEVSKGQEALVRVFERVLEVVAEGEGAALADPGKVVSCRLLVEGSQVGSIIGKGGNIVEKIRKECGCKIRVLNGKLPACARPTEEIVEIDGNVLAVKKALVAVSTCLQDCSPVDKAKITTNKTIDAVSQKYLPEMHMEVPPLHLTAVPCISTSSLSLASRPLPLSLETDGAHALNKRTSQQDVVFRVLCSIDRIGGLIGKGGNIIKALQSETGSSIHIGSTVADCDERLITITASESPEFRFSAAQKTVILVFSRSVETGIEKGLDSGAASESVTAKLVISPSQVGCLLGKGGAIMSEMRKATGAGIRIIGGNQVPRCVPENDQVVQISGNFSNVKDAIYHVTGRLRDNLFSYMLTGTQNMSAVLTQTSAYGHLTDPLNEQLRDPLKDPLRDPWRAPLRKPLIEPLREPLVETMSKPLRDPYMETLREPYMETLREPFWEPLIETLRKPLFEQYLEPQREPLRESLKEPLRESLRVPLRDPVPFNLQSSVTVSPNIIRHGTQMQRLDDLGLTQRLDLPPSPRLRTSQAINGVETGDIRDYGRGFGSFKGGLELGSGSKSAMVTNTSVEIVVPEHLLGAVYGENGSNLARLRQISGAKVIVHEPHLGSSDRVIVISGMPDETQTAQSLLQAFILTGK